MHGRWWGQDECICKSSRGIDFHERCRCVVDSCADGEAMDCEETEEGIMALKKWTKKKPGYMKKTPVVTSWLIDIASGPARKAKR